MFDKIKAKFGSGGGFDANTYLKITPAGADALQKEEISSLKQVAILDVLNEHSPKTLHAISKDAGININETRNEVSKLRQGHLVEIVED